MLHNSLCFSALVVCAVCALEEQQSRKIYYQQNKAELEKKNRKKAANWQKLLAEYSLISCLILEIDYKHMSNQATPKVMHMSHSTSLLSFVVDSCDAGCENSTIAQRRAVKSRSPALARNFHLILFALFCIYTKSNNNCVSTESCL